MFLTVVINAINDIINEITNKYKDTMQNSLIIYQEI